MNPPLYTWQSYCVESWLSHKGRGITQVVTGAGKTLMAIACAIRLNQESIARGERLFIKIIVPKTFLLLQWKTVLLSYKTELSIGRGDIGTFSGTHKDTVDRKIMLYVINSARYTLARHIYSQLQQGDRVLIIADECHHYASKENRKIFEFLSKITPDMDSHYHALGLSATPQVSEFEEILVPALGQLIFAYGFSAAMQSQVINDCILYNVGLPFDNESCSKYERLTDAIRKQYAKGFVHFPKTMKLGTKEYYRRVQYLAKLADTPESEWARHLLMLLLKRKRLVNNAPIRIYCAIALIDRLDEQAKIILFSERISQNEELYELLSKKYPNQVGKYHSKMGEISKKFTLDRFREGQLRILVSCKALDEGFDIPSVDVGIVLSGTATERQRVQRLGRILRRSEGKAPSNLFYLYIENTVEDSALLPESIPRSMEFDIHFHPEEQDFLHPVYDQMVSKILRKQKLQKMETKKLIILQETLLFGQLKSDWLLPQQTIQKKMEGAIDQTIRNYWICMMSLARLWKDP